MKEQMERKESKFKVTVTNKPSRDAIQDLAEQMIKIYHEILASETLQEVA